MEYLLPGHRPFCSGPWIIFYTAVENLVPGRRTFDSGPRSALYQASDNLVSGVEYFVSICRPFGTRPRALCYQGRGSFCIGRWIILYQTVDHLVLISRPIDTGSNLFGIYPCLIWYSAGDHLVPGRGSFGTESRVICYRATDDFVSSRGLFYTGPQIIWYWVLGLSVSGVEPFDTRARAMLYTAAD